MNYLDRIIVADNHEPRATAVSCIARGRASEVEVILPVGGDKSSDLACTFRERIHQCLADGENVMVVFCCMTGVRENVVGILRDAEKANEKGTRRILLDCHGSSTVNRGFKRRGVSRDGIRHIVYDMDGRWMDSFAKLLEGQ